MIEALIIIGLLLFLLPILKEAWGGALWHVLWPCALALGLLVVFG
jgi:hypothetical protein